jgi:hypothetical protein
MICVHFAANPMCHPLPANPAVSVNSTVWSLLEFQAGHNNIGGLLVSTAKDQFTDPNDGSEPLEELVPGQATTPQKISCSAASWSAFVCGISHLQGTTLNVPADMTPAGNSDHHFSYDDASAASGVGGEYDFWLAKQPGPAGSSMTVGGAGFCKWGTDGTGCSESTATNIATSIGGIDATVLKAAESNPNGTLGYAVASAALCADPSFVYPANASDGSNTNGSSACAGHTATGQRPPEGTRWYLNMTDDQVNATNNAPYVKVILRTMDRQHYGGVIVDTNWSGAPGLSIDYHRGDYSFAANEAGIGISTDMHIPITTNGIDLQSDIRFCSNGTC